MQPKNEIVNLISEINCETSGDLEGWFDNGKKIIKLFLAKNYTVQQKNRILSNLDSLTLREFNEVEKQLYGKD